MRAFAPMRHSRRCGAITPCVQLLSVVAAALRLTEELLAIAPLPRSQSGRGSTESSLHVLTASERKRSLHFRSFS